MIDSHCHLDLSAFDDDIGNVISRAKNAGITRILVPGTCVAGWQKQQQLCATYHGIDIAFGWHPWFLGDNIDADIARLETAISSSAAPMCAVGEIGLDATIDTPIKEQEHWLVAQLEIARSKKLPVILHHRKTHHRLPALIKQAGHNYGGVVHAFSGNATIAQQYTAQGFLLGIGGTVTYPRGEKTLEAIQDVGLTHLLLETDAPDMPMFGRQGKRNEPAFLNDVVSVLSERFNVATEEVITQTTKNYQRLFAPSGTTSLAVVKNDQGCFGAF